MTNKHTQGFAQEVFNSDGKSIGRRFDIVIGGECIAHVLSVGNDKCEGNKDLIRDAFNVTDETGLTPRELLNQRNELLEALKSTRYLNLHHYREGTIENNVFNEISEAIIKATKHEQNKID